MRWVLALVGLAGCHWVGWQYVAPQSPDEWRSSRDLYGSAFVGGAVCAEWAFQRDPPPPTCYEVEPDGGRQKVPCPEKGGD
jgi:hypothetical protein